MKLASLFPGLVREQEAGLKDFLTHDGFSVLMRGMQSDSKKLRTKSAFLLLNLLTSHPEHKGTTDSGCILLNHHVFTAILHFRFIFFLRNSVVYGDGAAAGVGSPVPSFLRT